MQTDSSVKTSYQSSSACKNSSFVSQHKHTKENVRSSKFINKQSGADSIPAVISGAVPAISRESEDVSATAVYETVTSSAESGSLDPEVVAAVAVVADVVVSAVLQLFDDSREFSHRASGFPPLPGLRVERYVRSIKRNRMNPSMSGRSRASPSVSSDHIPCSGNPPDLAV